MKKIIIIILCVFSPVFPVFPGPFIEITGVDTKSDYPEVSVDVEVRTPDGKKIMDLGGDNFVLYEDGYRIGFMQVRNLSAVEDPPCLIFSIDSSRSIGPRFLKEIKSSAADILASAGPEDQIAVYRFNAESTLLNNFTSKRDVILNSVNSVDRTGGRTLLYDSIYDSLELAGRVKDKRRAVIVFTDGKDTGSAVNDSDVIKLAQNMCIPVFFVVIECSDTDSIGRIAKLTGGGLVYTSETAKVKNLYKSILASLYNRYMINYITMFRPSNEIRELEVILQYDNIKDRDTFNFKVKAPFIFYLYIDEDRLIVAGAALAAFMVLLVFIVIISRSRRGGGPVKKLSDDEEKQPVIKRTDYCEPDDYITEPGKLEDAHEMETEEIPDEYADGRLLIKEKGSSGKTVKYLLNRKENTIGSSEDCSVVIRGGGVSPLHARIKKIDSAYYLFDMVSENGTFLNGSKLLRPKPLYDWDEIRIGKSTIIFRGISPL